MRTDIDLFRPLKAALDAIVNLGRTLAQVGPFFRMFEETMLVCLFRSPDDTGGCACGVETGVRLVAFVRLAELSVNGRTKFWWLSATVTCAYAAGMGDLIRVYGGPWSEMRGRRRRRARKSTVGGIHSKMQSAFRIQKPPTGAPVFPDPHLCALGRSRYLVPMYVLMMT